AAGLAGDLLGERQRLFRERAAGNEQQVLLAALAQHFGRLVDGGRGKARLLLRRRNLGDAVGLVPGGIGRQDQGRDLRRRTARGSDGGGTVGGDRLGVRRGLDPFRHR